VYLAEGEALLRQNFEADASGQKPVRSSKLITAAPVHK
jgi:hypothetical protein